MKIEDIIKMWSEDSNIDKNDTIEESVRTIRLHAKYYEIFIRERLKLAQMDEEKNTILYLKNEHYNGDLDFETLKEHGWPQFQKKILKSDIERHIKADKDVINFNLKYAVQKEKALALQEIIKSLNQRTFHIKNINDAKKFAAGEY